MNLAGAMADGGALQAGVARGLFPEERVEKIHRHLSMLLAARDAFIDRFYYCPHHPTEGTAPYRTCCTCRKPHPGMLQKAHKELGIELTDSFMIGDKVSDLVAGARAG